jgi:hypothetical protein
MGILSYMSPQYFPKAAEARDAEKVADNTAEAERKQKQDARPQAPPPNTGLGETFSTYG